MSGKGLGMTDGERELFATLDQNQKMMWVVGKLEIQSQHIDKLYDLNRGAIRTQDISKRMMLIGSLLGVVMLILGAINGGIRAYDHYLINKNEQRIFFEQNNKNRGEGQ